MNRAQNEKIILEQQAITELKLQGIDFERLAVAKAHGIAGDHVFVAVNAEGKSERLNFIMELDKSLKKVYRFVDYNLFMAEILGLGKNLEWVANTKHDIPTVKSVLINDPLKGKTVSYKQKRLVLRRILANAFGINENRITSVDSIMHGRYVVFSVKERDKKTYYSTERTSKGLKNIKDITYDVKFYNDLLDDPIVMENVDTLILNNTKNDVSKEVEGGHGFMMTNKQELKEIIKNMPKATIHYLPEIKMILALKERQMSESMKKKANGCCKEAIKFLHFHFKQRTKLNKILS